MPDNLDTPRRRWFRFGLRTMLAILCGTMVFFALRYFAYWMALRWHAFLMVGFDARPYSSWNLFVPPAIVVAATMVPSWLAGLIAYRTARAGTFRFSMRSVFLLIAYAAIPMGLLASNKPNELPGEIKATISFAYLAALAGTLYVILKRLYIDPSAHSSG